MARTNIPNIIIEHANLIFMNFSGNATKFTPKGVRTFSVILDEKIAKAMTKDGWNVKWPKPNEDGDVRDPHISVRARFDVKPPLVYMITSNNTTRLEEDMISILDSVDITNVDLIINAAWWKDNDDNDRVKAYLKSMYVTIDEDPLAKKYAAVIDKARGSADEDYSERD